MACCPPSSGPPVLLEYTPTGKKTTVGDVPVYVAGDLSGKKCIAVIPDIFGFAYSQVFQVTDRLAAEADAAVIAIDPFKGEPWADITLSDREGIMAWLATTASWDNLKGSVQAVINHAKEQGASSVSIVGFCYGALIAFKAGTEGWVSSAAGVHPTLFGKEKEIAEMLEVPVCVLPAEGDPMEAVKEVMDTKPSVASKCVYRRFDDQKHGFCAARGDWSKPEVAAGAGVAISVLASFFKSI